MGSAISKPSYQYRLLMNNSLIGYTIYPCNRNASSFSATHIVLHLFFCSHIILAIQYISYQVHSFEWCRAKIQLHSCLNAVHGSDELAKTPLEVGIGDAFHQWSESLGIEAGREIEGMNRSKCTINIRRCMYPSFLMSWNMTTTPASFVLTL